MNSRHAVLAAGLVAAGALVADGAAAQSGQRSFTCPHASVDLEIASSIPSGWQWRSHGAPLRRTIVRDRAAGTFLICDYGQAGNMLRPAPANASDCQAQDNGFVCTVSRRPRPEIISETVTMPQGSLLNLDNGKKTDRVSLGELAYMGNVGRYGRRPMLNVLTPGSYAIAGPEVNRIRDCANLTYARGEIVIGREVRIGDAICFRSGSGTVGILTIEDVDAAGIHMSYDAIRKFTGK